MRAVILGGTGAAGAATASRLRADGWDVHVTGRDPLAMPEALSAAGVTFHEVSRADVRTIGRLVGDDTDLLLDLVAYHGPGVRDLLPVMASVSSPVLVSSRAVYVDERGRHINGDEPPRFEVPLSEDTPTLDPAADGEDPFTREGYGPCKVAAEIVAVESGLPVTIIRPSKIHGAYARNPRTRSIVRKMLSGVGRIEIADHGRSVDHLTAAANLAALVQAVSALPEARVLNSADPDVLDAREIFAAIATAIDWTGDLVPVDDPHHPGRGDHPWRARSPIVLDTRRAAAIGYVPAGTGRDLIGDEVHWAAGIGA